MLHVRASAFLVPAAGRTAVIQLVVILDWLLILRHVCLGFPKRVICIHHTENISTGSI